MAQDDIGHLYQELYMLVASLRRSFNIFVAGIETFVLCCLILMGKKKSSFYDILGFVLSIICNHGGKMIIEILNMSMSGAWQGL